MKPLRCTLVALAAVACCGAARSQGLPRFEAPVLRGLAISPDQTRLVAVHSDVHRVTLFDLRDPRQPALLGEVEVGLDPVAVAMPSDDEVWVVSQGSDAIQVVDVANRAVRASIPTGDEPSDIVFARGRAFVSCPTDREIQVFDVSTHRRVGSVQIFADEPRALGASDDHVYVASYRSGNGTTLLPAGVTPPPGPPTNPALPPAPQVGRVVRTDDPTWAGQVAFKPADLDVFEIDAGSLAMRRQFSGVGTILSGMAVAQGNLHITHSDALNLVATEPALRGHVVDHRVTRIDLGPAGSRQVADLNSGIDYSTLPNPNARASSLAHPVGIEVDSAHGETLVAAFGTDRIGVLDPAGSVVARIEVGTTGAQGVAPRQKRGPRSLVQHGPSRTLYVLNRLSATVSVIDLATRAETAELTLPDDLTPAFVREGRGFLYDARLSGNGTISCASCHVDGGTDGLAWDLGDPGGVMEHVTLTNGTRVDFHPMKGPMLTMSLHGLAGTAPFHWRGDEPDFASFNGLFASLMGGSPLAAADLAEFEAFVMTLAYPANPRQPKSGGLSTLPTGNSAADGFQFFHNDKFFQPGPLGCVDCHPNPQGTGAGVMSAGLLRTAQGFEGPQLRGLYKRLMAYDRFGASTSGFGYTHDGEFGSPIDMALRFDSHLYDGSARIQAYLLEFSGDVHPAVGQETWIGGTDPATEAAARQIWGSLEHQSSTGNCDLILRGRLDGEPSRMVFDPVQRRYVFDDPTTPPANSSQITAWLDSGRGGWLVQGVPLGSGRQLAVDRDSDGVLDGAERPRAEGAASGSCPPRLTANAYPVRGQQAFGLVADGMGGSNQGIFIVGTGATDQPVLGLRILVDITTGVVVPSQADARGLASVALPLPTTASAAGALLYAQAISIAPCATAPWSASRRLRAQIR